MLCISLSFIGTRIITMTSIAVVFVALIASASCSVINVEWDNDWENYKIEHEKNYESPAEELHRRTIWEDNVRLILAHNKQADAGLHTYRLGTNEFADMSLIEYRAKMLGVRQDMLEKAQRNVINLFSNLSPETVPKAVDWRPKGYVTPVKNQGQCGSCWSFSATGSMEGQHFKKTGKLVSLSEQNLVDCSTAEGNEGCMGGLMDQAFEYVIKNRGIDTEASYPYEERNAHCRFNRKNVGATITTYGDIPRFNETALAGAAAMVGPISVAIDASHYTFQLYHSGIYNEPKCSQTQLDHGVLVVGYGALNGKNYWIVKNSWSPKWGQHGYVWMSKDMHNQCGIATQSSFPIV